MARRRGFTLIELLIVVALVVIVLAIVAPSFRGYILLQRLKGTNAELMTDVQLARSEAVARGRPVIVDIRASSGGSCYTMYTDTAATNAETADLGRNKCDCRITSGSPCAVTTTVLKTVQIPAEREVKLVIPGGQTPDFAMDHVTGGLVAWPMDNPNPPPPTFAVTTQIDGTRALRTVVVASGRPQTCVPAGATVVGYTACP